MARKALILTDKKIEQFIKDGRGQGEGAEYKPWLQIGDFSSQGRGHRIRDHITGRIHHLFSDLEANYYHILAWADAVIDIREQYPLLPRDATESIAEKLGYRHPKSPRSQENEVMTTDFLITVQDQVGKHLEARYVKYSSDLKKARVCEKLEIEKGYWEDKGIAFKVVTEESFDQVKAKNIAKLLSYYDRPQLDNMGEEDLQEIAVAVLQTIPDNQFLLLKDFAAGIDLKFGLPPGSAMAMFFHIAAHKIIPLQLDKRILGTQPLNEIIDWNKEIPTIISKGGLDYANYA